MCRGCFALFGTASHRGFEEFVDALLELRTGFENRHNADQMLPSPWRG